MSARRHLLISWCGRNERTGEAQPPAAPVEQWLAQLNQELSSSSTDGLMLTPAANPLARSNFDIEAPLSCDRRQLEARRWLDRSRPEPQQALALCLPQRRVRLSGVECSASLAVTVNRNLLKELLRRNASQVVLRVLSQTTSITTSVYRGPSVIVL